MDSITKNFTDKKYLKNFSESLKTEFMGKNIIFLPVTDSTNKVAKENIDILENGTVIIADCQTQGKGRKNRKWFSPPGQGLWFTTVIKNPKIKQKEIPLINILLSVAVAKTLSKYEKDIEIKWPNDVLLKRKKICGILSELKKCSEGPAIIAGTGIDTGKKINYPKKILRRASSLDLEGEMERELLLKGLIENFEEKYKILSKKGSEEILKEWKNFSVTLKSDIFIVNSEGEKILYRPLDIGSTGELIVENEKGARKSIYTDDEIIQKIQGLW